MINNKSQDPLQWMRLLHGARNRRTLARDRLLVEGSNYYVKNQKNTRKLLFRFGAGSTSSTANDKREARPPPDFSSQFSFHYVLL